MELVGRQFDWEDTLLIPIGDIQLQPNRDAVDIKGLKRTIQFGIDNNAYWVGMGDMVDLESPSNRRALRNAGLYDSAYDALDAIAEELEDEIFDLFKDTKGRWLGMLEGHHYHEHQTGGTSDTRLAQRLEAPFLGTSAFLNMRFKTPGKEGDIDFRIWAHHGRGGGALASGPYNKMEHVVKAFDADAYLMGHTHRVGHVTIPRVYPVFGKRYGTLEHKTLHLVSTGSFLKGWLEDHKANGRAAGLYPEAAMMNPTALGAAKIWFRPSWKQENGSGRPKLDVTVEA